MILELKNACQTKFGAARKWRLDLHPSCVLQMRFGLRQLRRDITCASAPIWVGFSCRILLQLVVKFRIPLRSSSICLEYRPPAPVLRGQKSTYVSHSFI